MARWFIDRSPRPNAPSISLRRLLPEATFVGGRDCTVSGLSADPEAVEAGQVFVALPRDGVADTIAVARAFGRGASGAVVERPSGAAMGLQAVVPDARAAQARLAHALAGDPSRRLDVVGVAGEGQGGVSDVLRAVFEADGRRTGVVGPLGWSDGLAALPAEPGAVDAVGLAERFARMAARGCVGAIVEVSRAGVEGSAIADGVVFAAALIPGVRGASDEDRDARKARQRAYARFVRRVRPGGLVAVDADDPDSEILGAVNLGARRVSFGIESADADVRAVIESVDEAETRFRIEAGGVSTPVRLRGGGLDAVRSALGAFALARGLGIVAGTIVAGLEAGTVRPGRSDRVDEGQAFAVRVSPARTPEALAEALAGLRAEVSGRVVCVVGAEGRGDREARRRLAEAAESGADALVFTSDNPRGEDPASILDDLLSSVRRPGLVRVEPDRRVAIERALAEAAPGDAVLIAGKGRNAFQILADRVVPFDDRAVASRWLREAARARRASA